MRVERAALDLVDLLNSSVESPAALQEFVDRTMDLTGSMAGCFHHRDFSAGHGTLHTWNGCDESVVRRYEAHYSEINPWSRRHVRFLSEGSMIAGDYWTDREFLASEYYNDFWKPAGFGNNMSCFFGIDSERIETFMLIHAPRRRFRAQDAQLLELLVGPLGVAERARRRAAEWQAALRQSHRLWDAVPYGALVLDRHGRVADVNRQATRFSSAWV